MLFKNFILVCAVNFLLGMPAFAVNILCLGDSLTEGYGVAKSEAWPAVTETMLREKKLDITLINAGISGSTTASAQARLRWHLKSQVKFDWMILALGANDGLRGQPVKGIKQNLQNVVDAAKRAGIKKIILAGIRVPPNYGKKYAADFSALYPELATAMNLPLMPFLLDGVAAKPELNLPDGIHPNAKGHQIIAQNIAKFIQANL
jgi:acyl-CoA thioesterase-1